MLDVQLCDCDPQRSSARWISSAVPEMPIHEITTSGDLTSVILKKKKNEILVIDGRAGDTNITRGILLDSDLVLIPTSPSLLDLEVTEKQCRLVQQIRRITQTQNPKARVILNKLGKDRLSQDAMNQEMIEEIPVLPHHLRYRAPFADAAGKGKLVWDLPFFTIPAQKEMAQCLQAIWDVAHS